MLVLWDIIIIIYSWNILANFYGGGQPGCSSCWREGKVRRRPLKSFYNMGKHILRPLFCSNCSFPKNLEFVPMYKYIPIVKEGENLCFEYSEGSLTCHKRSNLRQNI